MNRDDIVGDTSLWYWCPEWMWCLRRVRKDKGRRTLRRLKDYQWNSLARQRQFCLFEV